MCAAKLPTIGQALALLFLASCTGNVGLQPPTVAIGTPPGVTRLSSDAPEIPGGPPPMTPLPTLAMGSAPPAPPAKPVRSGTYTGVAWPMGSGGSCSTTREVSGFHVTGNAVRYGGLHGTIDPKNGVQMTNGQTWIYGQFEGESFAGQLDTPGPRGGAACTYQMSLSRIGP
jgi:hypothetical protein